MNNKYVHLVVEKLSKDFSIINDKEVLKEIHEKIKRKFSTEEFFLLMEKVENLGISQDEIVEIFFGLLRIKVEIDLLNQK